MNLSRRHLLVGAAALSAVGCREALPKAIEPKTFVLVHGTWHGAWVWRFVRNILQDRGHRVFTPTLTGCGERVHLSAPNIGLETHIMDIVNVVEFEDLSNVIISAHSFSGTAMTGAVDRVRDRIAHVNFFDAVVPRAGRMSAVEKTAEGDLTESFKARMPGFIDGYKMELFADYPFKILMPENHPRADWVRERITTHPMKAWTDELVLENGGWQGLPRSYFHAVEQDFAMTSDKMIGPARDEGWDFRELPVTRNGMVTHPKVLADALETLT